MAGGAATYTAQYRVRADGAEVWVHAPERVAEGTPACVVVPRTALLLFPQDSKPA